MSMRWIALTIPVGIFILVVALVPLYVAMAARRRARRRGGLRAWYPYALRSGLDPEGHERGAHSRREQRSFERSVRADLDLIDACPEVLDELRRSA